MGADRIQCRRRGAHERRARARLRHGPTAAGHQSRLDLRRYGARLRSLSETGQPAGRSV